MFPEIPHKHLYIIIVAILIVLIPTVVGAFLVNLIHGLQVVWHMLGNAHFNF